MYVCFYGDLVCVSVGAFRDTGSMRAGVVRGSEPPGMGAGIQAQVLFKSSKVS